MPACLRATVRIVSGIDDRSAVHTDVKLNKQTKILDFICSRNWKIKKRQVALDPGPQTPWSCCSVSWLCFLQSWLHPQAESPWMAEMVLRVPSCPLTIAHEGKHLFPCGSAKNPGRELVGRAQIASLELAAGGRTGQSYLNSWESGQRVMIPEEKLSKQKTPLCSVGRLTWRSWDLTRQAMQASSLKPFHSPVCASLGHASSQTLWLLWYPSACWHNDTSDTFCSVLW